MTRPITGLSGLAGYDVLIDEDSQATPEERLGGVADPRHAEFSPEEQIRRGSRIGEPRGPYGPDNQMLGDEVWFFQDGGHPSEDPNYDYTPATRAAPWPKGIASGPIGRVDPDVIGPRRELSNELHGVDTNADRKRTRDLDAQNDTWETIDQLNPGHTEQAELPKQMKSAGFGWGTTDRVQSMERQNEYGFDSAHQHRRWATGSIPGNTMWMRPGGRPLVKNLPGPAKLPVGTDSPFAGDDTGANFGIGGAILQSVPSEYVAPPQPQLAAPIISDVNDSVVEFY